eukprot:3479102-Pleurochrysis_carterae.AAC.2
MRSLRSTVAFAFSIMRAFFRRRTDSHHFFLMLTSMPSAESASPSLRATFFMLAALPSAKVRLSEVRRADIRYFTHIFTTREWQCRDIICALDEAGILVIT